jgi:hypothetical protein
MFRLTTAARLCRGSLGAFRDRAMPQPLEAGPKQRLAFTKCLTLTGPTSLTPSRTRRNRFKSFQCSIERNAHAFALSVPEHTESAQIPMGHRHELEPAKILLFRLLLADRDIHKR